MGCASVLASVNMYFALFRGAVGAIVVQCYAVMCRFVCGAHNSKSSYSW